MKRSIIILPLLFTLLTFSFVSNAAIPIARSLDSTHIDHTHTTNLLLHPRRLQPGNPHTEDMGVFGILALIFSLVLLFPLAITSGIIGTQNGRKLKGLAKAGLILGLIELTVLLGYLMYLFVLQ